MCYAYITAYVWESVHLQRDCLSVNGCVGSAKYKKTHLGPFRSNSHTFGSTFKSEDTLLVSASLDKSLKGIAAKGQSNGGFQEYSTVPRNSDDPRPSNTVLYTCPSYHHIFNFLDSEDDCQFFLCLDRAQDINFF